MKTIEASAHELRRIWTARLLRLLDDPRRAPEHSCAARLLQCFARAEDAAALEAIAGDPDRNEWVRIGALRAFIAAGIAPTRETFVNMLASCPRHGAHGPFDHPSHLLTTLLEVAACGAFEPELDEFMASLDTPRMRSLLLWSRGRTFAGGESLGEARRADLYDRYSTTLELDEKLAWATLERELSREFLFDGAERDLRLEYLSTDDLEILCATRPDVVERLVAHLMLPPPMIFEYANVESLRAAAFAALGDQDTALRTKHAAVRLLAAMPDPRHLLERAAAIATDDVIRVAIGRRRAEHEGCAYDSLPRESILQALERPRGVPFALAEWATRRDDPAIRFLGIRLLVAERRPIDDDVIAHALASAHPLVRIAALGAQVARHDVNALCDLVSLVHNADRAVERAEALRALRASPMWPDGYQAMCIDALDDDEIVGTYYAPVTTEAALSLSPDPRFDPMPVVDALVEAALRCKSDDTAFAIESVIGAWTDGEAVRFSTPWTWAELRHLTL